MITFSSGLVRISDQPSCFMVWSPTPSWFPFHCGEVCLLFPIIFCLLFMHTAAFSCTRIHVLCKLMYLTYFTEHCGPEVHLFSCMSEVSPAFW